jgi:protein-tyrosine phosphatase
VVKVLFVCMGNICRSPMAEGVFRDLVAREGLAELIETDSAGTHRYHIGEPPDARAQEAISRRGIDISDLRGRAVDPADFAGFDYVLAMDAANFDMLEAMSGEAGTGRLRMLLDFASQHGETEVPDPYYGAFDGFEYALDLIEDAAAGLLADIRAKHLK